VPRLLVKLLTRNLLNTGTVLGRYNNATQPHSYGDFSHILTLHQPHGCICGNLQDAFKEKGSIEYELLFAFSNTIH
jgi:hypothetical protein